MISFILLYKSIAIADMAKVLKALKVYEIPVSSSTLIFCGCKYWGYIYEQKINVKKSATCMSAWINN